MVYVDTQVPEVHSNRAKWHIFLEIDNLANKPILEHQKMNMAYIYLQKCIIFYSASTRWDEKLPANQNMEGFKDYFQIAYKALERTGV